MWERGPYHNGTYSLQKWKRVSRQSNLHTRFKQGVTNQFRLRKYVLQQQKVRWSHLKCIGWAAVKELSKASSITSKRRTQRNSRSGKIDKHKICYYGHHLSSRQFDDIRLSVTKYVWSSGSWIVSFYQHNRRHAWGKWTATNYWFLWNIVVHQIRAKQVCSNLHRILFLMGNIGTIHHAQKFVTQNENQLLMSNHRIRYNCLKQLSDLLVWSDAT